MALTCEYHTNIGAKPVMIHIGESALGTNQFVCARCSRIRETGSGKIVSLNTNYGYIRNVKKEFVFHFDNPAQRSEYCLGMPVKFEVKFLDNGLEAIHVITDKSKGEKNVYQF